jgi:hypothetical protein
MPAAVDFDAHEAVARAEDLAELLDHIAWRETILPALNKLSQRYQDLLTKAILGSKIVLATELGPAELSAVQLAGRVEGIAFITKLFESVLARGETAIKTLDREAATYSS